MAVKTERERERIFKGSQEDLGKLAKPKMRKTVCYRCLIAKSWQVDWRYITALSSPEPARGLNSKTRLVPQLQSVSEQMCCCSQSCEICVSHPWNAAEPAACFTVGQTCSRPVDEQYQMTRHPGRVWVQDTINVRRCWPTELERF